MLKSRSHEQSGAEFAMSDEDIATRASIFSPTLLAGHRVVISGGGSGIGKASAILFARLGAEVAICGRDIGKLEKASEFIERVIGRTIFYRDLSIRDPDAVAVFIGEAHDRLGGIDTLINNAGGQFPADAIDISRKGWLSVVDTNLNGTWWMMQEAAKAWRNRGQPGNIINLVISVERGCPQVAHTCASRAGVIYLTKTLSVEWAPLGIKVNCLAPGSVQTEGFRMYPAENIENFREANPMKGLSNAFDIAQALVYMSSPATAFMTGSLVAIDGGQSQWGVTWPAGRPAYFDGQG